MSVWAISLSDHRSIAESHKGFLMKNIFLGSALLLSIFILFACGSSLAPASEVSSASKSDSSALPFAKARTSKQPSAQPSTPEPAPASTPTPAPAPTPPAARTTVLILDGATKYTVVKGDTLTKIARKMYRNAYYYPLILMASSDVVKNQDLIKPGMVLTIPKLQVNLKDPKAKEGMKTFFLKTADITERKRPRDAAALRRFVKRVF